MALSVGFGASVMRVIHVAWALTALLFLIAACTGDSTPVQTGVTPATATVPSTTTVAAPVTAATPADAAPAPTPAVDSDKPSTAAVSLMPAPIAVPSPTTSPPVPTEVPEPPRRDLYELARSLRHKSRDPIPYLDYLIPTDLQVGQVDSFKVLANVEPVEFHTISARLEHVSDNAYWYVQRGARFGGDDLEKAASVFEERILPGLEASFGPLWKPDDPSGQRLTILHASTRGLAGYYSSADEYPARVHENSNQRKMIYINPGALRIGTEDYLSVLTHELQHAINWNLSGGQTTWLNEGLAQVAEYRLGWRPASGQAFVHSAPAFAGLLAVEHREFRGILRQFLHVQPISGGAGGVSRQPGASAESAPSGDSRGGRLPGISGHG